MNPEGIALTNVKKKVAEFKAGIDALYQASLALVNSSWDLTKLAIAIRDAGNLINQDLAKFPDDGRSVVRVVMRPSFTTVEASIAALTKKFATNTFPVALGAMRIYLEPGNRVATDNEKLDPSIDLTLAIPDSKMLPENLVGITHLPKEIAYLLFADKFWHGQEWAMLTTAERQLIDLILCPQRTPLAGAA